MSNKDADIILLKEILQNTMKKANGTACAIINIEEDLKYLNLNDENNIKNLDTMRNQSIGAYNTCKELLKREMFK